MRPLPIACTRDRRTMTLFQIKVVRCKTPCGLAFASQRRKPRLSVTPGSRLVGFCEGHPDLRQFSLECRHALFCRLLVHRSPCPQRQSWPRLSLSQVGSGLQTRSCCCRAPVLVASLKGCVVKDRSESPPRVARCCCVAHERMLHRPRSRVLCPPMRGPFGHVFPSRVAGRSNA